MGIYPTNPLNVGQPNFNPYFTPVQNPIVPNYPVVQQPAPHMEIQRVNGKESAFAYPIGPNSSVVLVDNLASKIWIVTTDSSGFKAVNGFKVIPDDEEAYPPIQQDQEIKMEENPAVKELTDRIEKLEERMDSYVKPDTKSFGQNKPGNGNAQSNDRNGSGSKGSDGNH